MFRVFLLTVSLLLTVNLGSAALAATVQLQVNAIGKIAGATNVNVGGALYDVVFQGGSCIAVFDGCDENSDFDLNGTEALLASQALLDDVLLDTSLGSFDSDASLVVGCSDISQCNILTPYSAFVGVLGLRVTVAQALNSGTGGVFADQANWFGGSASEDYGTASATYALWSPSEVSAVPVPASLPLLLVGVGMLAVTRRRQS